MRYTKEELLKMSRLELEELLAKLWDEYEATDRETEIGRLIEEIALVQEVLG